MTNKAWQEKNTGRAKKRYQRNRVQILARAKLWGKNNPDMVKDKNLRHKYGITLADYRAIAKEQGNACAICGGGPSCNKELSVDHCHETGNVRGLLCENCNYALGCLKDRPELFMKAIDYLENSRIKENTHGG
jgi:hypothetical protein